MVLVFIYWIIVTIGIIAVTIPVGEDVPFSMRPFFHLENPHWSMMITLW
jgi:hypothetical protein